jgi:hypothetical protein
MVKKMTEQTILEDADTKAKCCAICLQAVNHLYRETKQGCTYEQVQKWIELNRGFYMSAVNRRCQEMAKWRPAMVRIVHDMRGKALVFPIDAKPEEKNRE